MNFPIVQSHDGVTLVAGGPVRKADLALALGLAPRLVAADGGANRLLDLGQTPEAVIGDMDSLQGAARAALGEGRIHTVPEQETTDFEKCWGAIAAPFVLGLGCLGGRVDHELAVFSALVRGVGPPCLLLGGQDVVMAAPRALRLELRAGDRVSLFPMAQVTGRSAGLRWPIAGLQFAPDGRVGTSNMAEGPVELEFDGAGMLVILPRARLRVALNALVSGV